MAMIKVRVSVVAGPHGYQTDRSEHFFPTLPRVGETVSFTDHRRGDYQVVGLSYTQDIEDTFTPVLLVQAV